VVFCVGGGGGGEKEDKKEAGALWGSYGKKSICFLSEKIYPLNLKIKQYLLPNRDNL